MKFIWGIILSVAAICLSRTSEATKFQYFDFAPVDQLPRADVEIAVPFSFSGYEQCARHCALWGATCQGFVMDDDKVYPCTLLKGLTGITDEPTASAKAYVNLYFEGEHYVAFSGSISWFDAEQLCHRLGREVVSYTTSAEKEKWIQALAGKLVFIAGRKDPADPTRMYDTNTGETLTITWKTDAGPDPSNVLLIEKINGAGYRTGNDWFTWQRITVVCSPK